METVTALIILGLKLGNRNREGENMSNMEKFKEEVKNRLSDREWGKEVKNA